MNDISEFFKNFLSPDSWPARWFCGRWTPFHGWLYIISSLLIAAAYFSIPLILFIFIRKAKKNNLPFQGIFWLFILFILACGFTHVADAVMFWYPAYRFSAILLFITAIVSWAAVVGSYKVLPAAMQLKSPAALEKIIDERTEELARANEYLQQTNTELKEAQRLSEILMKQKDDFISIASHELKTPVTSMKMYAYMLENDEAANSEKTKNMVNSMNVQIGKLTTLINKMLDSSKLQEGRLAYNMEYFRINELVADVVNQMQSITQSHKIIIEQSTDVLVYADKDSISQVFENLITNAIKYSRHADKLIIKIENDKDDVICSVQDFGIGIPEDQQRKIFDRFYRVSGEDKNTYPGMGLGLYIVKDIIERHEGKIWLESAPGKGSVFFFKLKIATNK